MFGLDQRLEFNGQDLTRWCVIEDVRLPLMAPVRNDWHDQLTLRTGRKHRRSVSMPMTIEIDARLWEQPDQTLEEVAAELAACLHTDGPAVLTVNGRNYNAVVDGSIDRSDWFDLNAAIPIRFVCGDGTWFSDEITLDLPDASSVVAIAGTAPNRPLIELTLIATATTVFVKTGGNEMKLIGSWPAGTVFMFDCENNTVSINGTVDNTAMTLGSRPLELAPGLNTIERSAGTAKLTYAPRYF